MKITDLKSKYGKGYYKTRLATRREALREMKDIIKADEHILILEEKYSDAYWWFFSSSIYLELPWSFSLIQEAKEFMANLGWEFISESDSMPTREGGNASKFIYYKVPNSKLNVKFEFNSGKKDSTCVLNKIGEKEVTEIQPIFEVVCSDEAAEEFALKEEISA